MREVRSTLLVLVGAALIGHIVGAEEPKLSAVYEPVVAVPSVSQSVPPVAPVVSEPKVTPPRVEKQQPKATPKSSSKTKPRVYKTELGVASVYWEPQTTSTGRWYDGSGYLTAHRTAPVGTVLLVTCIETGLSKHVVVCDSGPAKIWDSQFSAYRIVDISPATAREIGLPGSGVDRLGLVKVEWVR